MFVGVARVTLQIPESGSLKAKRQVLRRVTDRVKARFNVSLAEVDDNDLWQKATLALAVVGNDSRHVNEQLDKILHFIEELYVAPLVGRELEIIPLGDKLFASGEKDLPFAKGDRSLAEAEGLAEWETPPVRRQGKSNKKLSLEEARAKARTLRNRRDWESEP